MFLLQAQHSWNTIAVVALWVDMLLVINFISSQAEIELQRVEPWYSCSFPTGCGERAGMPGVELAAEI